MVQFLSIIFFLGFLQFLLGFSKVPVFLCHSVHSALGSLLLPFTFNFRCWLRIKETKEVHGSIPFCGFLSKTVFKGHRGVTEGTCWRGRLHFLHPQVMVHLPTWNWQGYHRLMRFLSQ